MHRRASWEAEKAGVGDWILQGFLGSGAKNQSGSFGDNDTEGRGQGVGTSLFLGNGGCQGAEGGWEKTGLMSSGKRGPHSCEVSAWQRSSQTLFSDAEVSPKVNRASASGLARWPLGVLVYSMR